MSCRYTHVIKIESTFLCEGCKQRYTADQAYAVQISVQLVHTFKVAEFTYISSEIMEMLICNVLCSEKALLNFNLNCIKHGLQIISHSQLDEKKKTNMTKKLLKARPKIIQIMRSASVM